jgi:hypothetical protein
MYTMQTSSADSYLGQLLAGGGGRRTGSHRRPSISPSQIFSARARDASSTQKTSGGRRQGRRRRHTAVEGGGVRERGERKGMVNLDLLW